MTFEEALAAIERVRKLHKPTEDGLYCSHDFIECHSYSGLYCDEFCKTFVKYPCPTIKALEGE